MTNFDHEFLSALSEIEPVTITEEIWSELKAYHPDRYGNKDYQMDKLDEETLVEASKDYLHIVKSYLRVSRLPILMETLVAGFLWGVTNLKEQGLDKAPNNIKATIARMKSELQPQAEQLEDRGE